MKSFTDNASRVWVIDINVDTIKRVRALIGFDLLKVIEGDYAKQLADDPIQLVDVIFAIVKPAADLASVTDEQFGKAMAGDAIGNATTALLEDLADFFPSSRRSLLRGILEKSKAVETRTLELATAKLAAMDVDTLSQLLTESSPPATSGDSSTSLPASPASTPAP